MFIESIDKNIPAKQFSNNFMQILATFLLPLSTGVDAMG
jgi:hypothetical protein